MYTCDRCGKKYDDAYSITKYFNGMSIYQTVCLDCIKKIGHDNPEEGNDAATDNDSDLPNDNSPSTDR